jgi:hypothetical protein
MLQYIILFISFLFNIAHSHLKNNPHPHNYDRSDDNDDRRTLSPTITPIGKCYQIQCGCPSDENFNCNEVWGLVSSCSNQYCCGDGTIGQGTQSIWCPYNTIPPSLYPTSSPSLYPTSSPSLYPTSSPSLYPTSSPSLYPTSSPSLYPTSSPSLLPIISRSTVSNNDMKTNLLIFIISGLGFVGIMGFILYKRNVGGRNKVIKNKPVISFENNISEETNDEHVYLEPTVLNNIYNDIQIIDSDGEEHAYNEAIESGLINKNELYDELHDELHDVNLYDQATDDKLVNEHLYYQATGN